MRTESRTCPALWGIGSSSCRSSRENAGPLFVSESSKDDPPQPSRAREELWAPGGSGALPRALAALVLLSLLFVPAPASAGSPPIPPHVVTLAAHAPVLIEGDAALGTSDAVVSGSGTPQDPYVMEGWSINASANPGIAIRNTTKSLLIRNVTLYRTAPIPLADGVDLLQVRNVQIPNITALATLAAVRVRSSYHIS